MAGRKTTSISFEGTELEKQAIIILAKEKKHPTLGHYIRKLVFADGGKQLERIIFFLANPHLRTGDETDTEGNTDNS